MATPIYAWFNGTTQGKISGWGSWPGEDDQAGREDSSLVQQFEHEISIPTDVQSGMAAGRRKHGPVKIVKRIDTASPMLYQALCTGERLTEVTFKWFRTDSTGGGGQQHYFTTLLEEAVIVSMKEWFPITADQTRSTFSHFEDVCLTYRKITWTWEDGGVTATDDWKSG